MRIPPRAPAHWLRGNLREIQADPLGFLLRLHREHGDISLHRLGPFDYHLIAHPDAVKRVLQDNHPNYTKRVSDVQAVGYLTGPGVLVTGGQEWIRRRRLMQPAFHRDRIHEMTATMQRLTSEWIAEWERDSDGGRVFLNASERITRLTIRIAAVTLFSLDLDSKAGEVMDAFSTISYLLVRRFRQGRMFRPLPLFADDRAFLRELRRMDAVIDSIIRATREARAKGAAAGADLMNMLMDARDEETGESLSDLELRAEVKTLLLAGHETTSNALAWAFWLLGAYPHLAECLHREARLRLHGRTAGAEDLPHLDATRRFFEETMRLYPPAWYTARRAEAPDELLGFHIPAGARLVISPYLLHRHPAFWPDPLKFDPERFAVERRERMHRFAYFPFGGGPRLCIGNNFAMAEALIILSAFTQRFRVELATPDEPAPSALITLRMKDDLRIRAVPSDQPGTGL